MVAKLEDREVLRKQIEEQLAHEMATPGAIDWMNDLARFLQEVKDASPTRLRDRTFLMKLWESEAVSSTGMGTVKIEPAIQDDAFVDWFAEMAGTDLSTLPTDVEVWLTDFYDDLLGRLGKLCARKPHLKVNRVFAALYPERFTTIANVHSVLELYQAMGGSYPYHPVHAQLSIRRRVDEILGPMESASPLDLARRMCVPWYLLLALKGDEQLGLGDGLTGQAEREKRALSPRPVTLRRKGLTAIRGGFQAMLALLPSLDGGLSREEFADVIRQANPELAPGSIGAVINVLCGELGVSQRDGDTYHLTPRGIQLLATQDPNELADRLLTEILGVDHVVVALAQGPKDRAALSGLLQRVNPGWTSTFAPSALLSWLVSLGVITSDGKLYKLTAEGLEWRDMVTWEPEYLPQPPKTIEEIRDQVELAVSIPEWPQLKNALGAEFGDSFLFDEALAKKLHAGLWFHPVRHFAVLTGISGSGKTQLAVHYGMALCGTQHQQDFVRVIPVQPGWFDPSHLLGYVPPFQQEQEAYQVTPFLRTLLSAVENPERPHVVVLDEMNLSHPEQYMAPILSAMETVGEVELHDLPDGATHIPKSIRYPANLAIIGTINMDETTLGLSDKVLDRAFTLEFWEIDVSAFPGWKGLALSPDLQGRAKAVLMELTEVLAPARLHFGWRVISDVLGYLVFAVRNGTSETDALDDVVYAKVLPKLRGEVGGGFDTALNGALQVAQKYGMKRCATRLESMRQDLESTSTARFWR